MTNRWIMNDHGTPLVSVCMITYNHEAFISKAIKGVLSQECKFHYELVIGEDHSDDGTLEICQSYSRKNPDIIRVIETGKNVGITANFIRTLASCSGKYIAICEGDDYWTDSLKLQKQVDFLESNPGIAIIAGRVEMVDKYDRRPSDLSQLEEQLRRIKSEPDFFDLLDYNMINTPSTCIRANVVQRLTMEARQRGIWYCIDYWFWLKTAVSDKLYISDEIFACYRVHSDGASRDGAFLKKRIPWVRFDAINQYYREHSNLNHNAKATLLKIVAGIAVGHDTDLHLRIMATFWCMIHPWLLISWYKSRRK